MNTAPLHHPSMREDPGKEGTYCFLNSTRVCGPDCTAFISPIEKPEGQDYIGKEWAKCHLMINAHRVGKHVAIIAVAAGDLLKKVKNHLADAERVNQPGPQEPR